MKQLVRIALIGLLVLLPACGSAPTAQTPSASTPAPSAAPETSPAASEAAPATAAFPVTIEHKFGSTEITAEPTRVLTIGYSEQDAVLALGVEPIAVREWFGGQPHAVWPWAQDELGDATPEVLEMPFGELNFETIAALEPDLIIGTHSGITEEEYSTLSQIAPTLAQSAGYPDFGMPWQEQTRSIGRALGRAEQAETLVADVEAQIEAAREEHPEFASATVAWANPTGEAGQFYIVGPNTPPMRFLTTLGLTYPDQVAEVVGSSDSAQISSERLDLIDVDVLIMQASTPEEREAIESNPLYAQLNVAREGRTIFFEGLDDPLYGAPSFSTVLSLPFAVEGLVPQIAAAINGGTAAATATADTTATTTTDAAGSVEVLETTATDRLIRHEFGETRVPLNPQRIVAADLGSFVPTAGVLAALNIKPVAITADVIPSYLKESTEGVQILPGQANYEAIAALQPDLIITPGVEYNRENYDILSQIAPTVAPEWYWQALDQSTSYWRSVATIVNKQAEGEQLVTDLTTRIDQVRADLEPRMHDKPVSVLQVQGTGLEAIYLQTGRLESALLEAVGVPRPANQTYDPSNPEWYVTLSPELLPEADAWAIFAEVYAANPEEIPQARQDLEASPLWGQLEAVQNDRVFYVATDEWSGTDPFVAQLILDTIETNLKAALDANP